jgi:hypothetical protein
MAKITIPYSAASGADKTPTEEVNQSFFSAKKVGSTMDSGAALNGFLQHENLKDVLTYRDFKRKAFCFGESIGATDNVDYFPELFPAGCFIADGHIARELENADTMEEFSELPRPKDPTYHLNFPIRTDFFQPIPGLNKTFYNPYEKALVIFTWNMSLAIDGYVTAGKKAVSYTSGQVVTSEGTGLYEDNMYGAWVIFKLFDPDGEEIENDVRKSETAFRTVLPKMDRPASGARRGAQNDLYYSGHLMFELTKPGWYTGGVQLGYSGPPLISATRGLVPDDGAAMLYTYSLESDGMKPNSPAAAQEPDEFEYRGVVLDEPFTIWDQGIRQARVRVRSIRNILFKL